MTGYVKLASYKSHLGSLPLSKFFVFILIKHVLVPQGAAKLQGIKVLVSKKSKVFIGGAVFI